MHFRARARARSRVRLEHEHHFIEHEHDKLKRIVAFSKKCRFLKRLGQPLNSTYNFTAYPRNSAALPLLVPSPAQAMPKGLLAQWCIRDSRIDHIHWCILACCGWALNDFTSMKPKL